MYSIHDYARMISDRGRMDAYASALKRNITAESVIVDLGTGTGIFALLACQLGARKVYAIEPADVIQVARDCARGAGVADRIVFIQEDSTRVDLPEKAHGIISDIRGAVPLFGKSISTVVDARERFLQPGGWMMAMRDTLWVAVAPFETYFTECVAIWDENPYGLNMAPTRHKAANSWGRVREKNTDFVTPPGCWGSVDYRTVVDPNVEGEAELEVHTAGDARGLCVWFDCEVAEGITFSCNPGAREGHIYHQAVFPWPKAIQMSVGDVVSISLRATLSGSDYVWQWESRIKSADGVEKAAFRQNSFAGTPVSSEKLRRQAHTYSPALGEEGKITLEILQRMQAGVRLEEIAREIHQQYPGRYVRWQDALTEVGELSAKYCA